MKKISGFLAAISARLGIRIASKAGGVTSSESAMTKPDLSDAESLGADDRAALSRFLQAVDAMRVMHPEGKLRWLSELLQIAIEEGLEVGDYAANLDLDNSAVAIDVLALGPVLRGGPGLDLIQTTPSSDKLRKHQVRLTPKGRKLIGEMLRHLREK